MDTEAASIDLRFVFLPQRTLRKPMQRAQRIQLNKDGEWSRVNSEKTDLFTFQLLTHPLRKTLRCFAVYFFTAKDTKKIHAKNSKKAAEQRTER